MIVKEISRKDYDEFLEKVKSYSFLQTSAMNEVLISNNRKTKLLGLVDNGEVLAVGLAFIRKIYGGNRIDLMVGASAVDENYEYIFYDKLRDYVKELDCLKLVIKLDKDYIIYDQEGNPIEKKDRSFIEKMEKAGYNSNDKSIFVNDGSADYQFVKDLSEFLPDKDKELLKSFNSNARRKIKKAKDLDINVRPLRRDEIEDFKVLTLETSKRQGFGDKSLAYYQTFYDEFKDNSEFLVSEIDLTHSIEKLEKIVGGMDPEAKNNKQRIKSLQKEIDMLKEFREDSDKDVISLANMILIYLKDQAIYFLGGSLTKYQKLPGAFKLQYEAMKRICKKNIPIYNFYGIDGVFDGSDGVLRFKQNFNGYIIRKAGGFTYYPNPGKYKILEFIKKIKRKFKK